MNRQLRVCALYPSRMNIYADRGNILTLRRRCENRGIEFVLTAVEIGQPVDPGAHDLFYVGGGQDSDQLQVAGDLVATKRAALASAVEDGKVLLAVCGGYQLLGEFYELDDQRIPGLGLVDLKTLREPGERLIGNIAIEVTIGGDQRILAGFENHGGRTHLGPDAKPLGKVIKGHGNNGRDGFEGVRHLNLFGTYLHGPLLPKNWWLADHLIELALGGDVELAPLDDALEAAAHESALRAAGVAGTSGLAGSR
jgi:CobQ-like glutamine amidotransferase family enzyme